MWINGQNVSERTDVVSAIATGLTTAQNPLIVIDAIDLAGAAEVVELARSVGATLDHAAPDNVALLQEQGWLGTTPGEAVLRSDAVLLVGPLPEHIATDEALRRLCDCGTQQRTFRYIGSKAPPGAIANLVGKGLAGTDVGNISLTGLIGALRAHVAGNAFNVDDATRSAVSALGDWLQSAQYGVAVFATGALSDLEGHALLSLLDDLSQTTRWNGLPLAIPAGQNELQRMSSSLSGLPAPLAFHGSKPHHDRWLHSARNAVERSECDSVLWVSSSVKPVPDWLSSVANLYAISAHDDALAGAKAQAKIGIAGVDYAAILEPAEIGAFAAITPPDARNNGSAACIIGSIRKAVETSGATA